MEIDRRATPCVGICSTTYGDLVCRGCKRFAHEIVAWNSYGTDQHDRVWRRLSELRDAATAMYVEIVDGNRLEAASAPLRLAASTSRLSAVYELLRRRSRAIDGLGSIGVCPRDPHIAHPAAVRDAIDSEFLRRSVAVYEHSFHVPAGQ